MPNPISRSLVRWGVPGFLLGAGLCLLIGASSEGAPTQLALHDLGTGLPGGCTALALDRDKGRTEASPCADFGAQLAASLKAPEPLPVPY